MKAIRSDGSEVKRGDIIKDFRDEEWIFRMVTFDGKIFVNSTDHSETGRVFFPSVFKLEVIE